MYFFHRLSQWLTTIATLLLLFELGYQWLSKLLFRVRTVGELWIDINPASAENVPSLAAPVLSSGVGNFFLNLPFPVVIYMLAAVFYIIFRLMLLSYGGGRAQRL